MWHLVFGIYIYNYSILSYIFSILHDLNLNAFFLVLCDSSKVQSLLFTCGHCPFYCLVLLFVLANPLMIFLWSHCFLLSLTVISGPVGIVHRNVLMVSTLFDKSCLVFVILLLEYFITFFSRRWNVTAAMVLVKILTQIRSLRSS